jgi:predicted aspartyl protease
MTRAKAVILSGVLIALGIGSWAVPNMGAARLLFPAQTSSQAGNKKLLPRTVTFRDFKSQGLLAKAWFNDRGPFTVTLDTGAGKTVISERVARDIGAKSVSGRSALVGGLTGREVTAREVVIDEVALGDRANFMPGTLRALVAPTLNEGIDAILDPTQAYSPLGYTIDIPNRTIVAFDPTQAGLSLQHQPSEGATVSWLSDQQGKRPFVRLSDGRKALIDTGSTFGLAVTDVTLIRTSAKVRVARDLGGGSITAHRVAPTTVSIGALELRDVPTDILSGIEKGSPIILGRDALYPFRITFDPLHRLIEIAPSGQDD